MEKGADEAGSGAFVVLYVGHDITVKWLHMQIAGDVLIHGVSAVVSNGAITV